MAYLSTLPCDVLDAYCEEFGAPHAASALYIGACAGRVQVMHLGDRKGYRPPDNQTDSGCEQHHHDIDGDLGGCGRWFVGLGDDRRRRLEYRLIARGTAKWMALTPEERAGWDERAAPANRRRAS
jgi:hypothetical protein